MNQLKIGFLLSGKGSTLKNLLNKIVQNQLDICIAVVISSKINVGGLNLATHSNIPNYVVPYRTLKHDIAQYSRCISKILDAYQIDLVVLGGFLSLYHVPKHYENKVINIHPSLIPQFCGAKFYGRRVHDAVIASNTKTTGCTVHFVDNEYDHGPIIAQQSIPVEPHDTPSSLEQKIQQLELKLYPQVIQSFVNQKKKSSKSSFRK